LRSVLNGVKRIELSHQKRHTWDLTTRRTNSFCACINYVGRKLCGVAPIKKGEMIIAIKRVSNYHLNKDGETVIWYKRERWRLGCWIEALRLEGVSYQLSNNIVVEERPKRRVAKRQVSKVHGLTPEQMRARKNLQSKRSTLLSRLADYRIRPVQTDRVRDSMATIENQLEIISKQLELPRMDIMVKTDTNPGHQFDIDEWLSENSEKS